MRTLVNTNPKLEGKIYKFDLKNDHGIPYQDVHKYIKTVRSDANITVLEKENTAITLAGNVTQLMHTMFTGKISNGDFHGNNMKISFTDKNTKNHKHIEHIEAFDWATKQ